MFTNNVYVTVNGLPLHGTDTYGSEWIVNKTDGFLDGAPSTLATTQKIWSHGVFTNQPFYSGRVVSLEGFVRGTTAENAILSWDTLKQALSLDTQDVTINWRGYKRLLRGKQSGQPLVEWFDRYTLKFSLEFTSNTPFLYSAGGALSGSTYLPHTNGGMTFPYVFEGDETAANLSTRWTGTANASTSTLSQDGAVVATNLDTTADCLQVKRMNADTINAAQNTDGTWTYTTIEGSTPRWIIPVSVVPPVVGMIVFAQWAETEVQYYETYGPVVASGPGWVAFAVDDSLKMGIKFPVGVSFTLLNSGIYPAADWSAMQALGVDWFDGDTYPGSWVNDWGFPEVSTSGSITLNNHGTASSPVTITISGYVVNPRIEHRQTGAVLALDYTIPVGETVILNSETREVLINGKIPSQQIVSSRQWFTAGPGENTFMFSADSASNEANSTAADMNLAIDNAQELLINGSFETGDLTGWEWINKNNSVGVYSTFPYDGTNKLSLVFGDPSSKIKSSDIKVSPNHTYRVSAYVRSDTVTSSARQINLGFSKNGSTTYIFGQCNITTEKQYFHFSYDYTTTSSDTTLAVFASTYSSDGVPFNCSFDAFSLKDITDVEVDDSDKDTAMATVEMREAWL